MSAPFRLRSTVTRTSGVAAFLRLARLPGLPCGSPWRATRDASDQHLLPITFTTSTRASCVPEPSSGPGEIGVSRRRDSLRRARGPALGGVFFPIACLGLRLWCSCRASPPPGLLLPETRASSKRQDRLATCLVKGLWRPRPGAPSIARWRAPHASRAIVSDPRVTELVFCRSRDFAITTRRSALLRWHLLTAESLSANLGSRMSARPRRRESMFG